MLKRIIPHACIVLALVALTLFILVQYNPGIAASMFYRVTMYSFFAMALVTAGCLIAENWRK